MSKKTYVHLRIYKGAEILVNESGKVVNENQLVKLQIGTISFENYLKNIGAAGFNKIEAEKFLYEDGTEAEKTPEVLDAMKKISNVFKPFVAPKTEAELKIEALEKKLAELEAKGSVLTSEKQSKDIEVVEEEVVEPQSPIMEEKPKALSPLAEVRKQYAEITGKNASPRATYEELKAEVERLTKN